MLHLISKGLNLPGESEMVRKVLRLFLIKSKKVACCKDMEVTFLLTSPSTPSSFFLGLISSGIVKAAFQENCANRGQSCCKAESKAGNHQ